MARNNFFKNTDSHSELFLDLSRRGVPHVDYNSSGFCAEIAHINIISMNSELYKLKITLLDVSIQKSECDIIMGSKLNYLLITGWARMADHQIGPSRQASALCGGRCNLKHLALNK